MSCGFFISGSVRGEKREFSVRQLAVFCDPHQVQDVLKMQHVSHDDIKQNILQNANALKGNSSPYLFYIRRIGKRCGSFQATNDPPEFCKPHSLLQIPRGSDTRPVSNFKWLISSKE
jgi:hypothetical protein